MWKKIKEYCNWYLDNHPKKALIIILASCVIISLLLELLPADLGTAIVFLLQIVMIIYISKLNYNSRKSKKKLEESKKQELEKKWGLYIDLVDDVFQSKKARKNLDINWINNFDELVLRMAERNWGTTKNWVDDFELASCLMYALTWNNNDDSNILYAFECMKHLICNPKVYNCTLKTGSEVQLKIKEYLPSVEISALNEIYSAKGVLPIIRNCLKNKNEEGIMQFSKFLHNLYLKCE